jgi:purine-binding chemotaxis protein CheW
MDHEYDDDRLADRAGDIDPGEQPLPGPFADEFAFEAPDLATAFLAALDAVDDRRFVSPSLDDLTTPPAAAPVPEEAQETGALEAVAPEAAAMEAGALEAGSLEAGTFELTAVDAYGAPAEPEPTPYAADAMPSAAEDYVIEHDPAATVDDSASARAVAEAFAREQAALELWGSDEASALLDSAASEAVTEAYPEPLDAIDSIESIEASHAVAPLADSEAALAESPLDQLEQAADANESPVELIAETVSNADSYYDPDTLRLTRPLFSPDEPRAFVAPVYVGETSESSEGDGAEAAADVEAEVLEDLEEFVAFSLGDTRCVVPIRNVIEIGRIPQAVAVPNAPAWLHGLGNLRGQVLSLIDLRAFLGIGRVRPASGRMLVLRADDDEVQAGLLVDHVHQIVSLSASRFHPVPETLARHYARHAWGVCDYGNFTMIGLEVDSLLGVENMTPLGEAAEVM